MTYCLHDTKGSPIREERHHKDGRVIHWYRCRKCGKEFTEPYPTVMVKPPRLHP